MSQLMKNKKKSEAAEDLKFIPVPELQAEREIQKEKTS